MITIIPVKAAQSEQEEADFYKSLKAQTSKEDVYQIGEEGKEYPESRIIITLPNNCLVLGNSWDRYIDYALDHDQIIDEALIIRRMGLVSRPDNGVFKGLTITIPSSKQTVATTE